MSFVVVCSDPSGGAIAFTTPAPDTSVSEAIAICPFPQNAFVKQFSDLPMSDADFIPAWRLDASGNISIDIPTARELTKDRLRTERAPLLQKLDVAFMKALETGQPTADITAEKQRLRDITTLPDACNTTAELRALKCAQ